jgi:4-hydroxybenzoyl-CoA thioesterase
MTDAPYVHRYQVSFSDTDSAAIAFTGRFPMFALDAIEGWFRDRLGTDWYRLNMDDHTGTPFVHLSLDFLAPLTPRDVLVSTVLLAKAGRSSLTFRVLGAAEADARACFEGRFVCAFTDHDVAKSIPIPDKFRTVVDREVALAAAHA